MVLAVQANDIADTLLKEYYPKGRNWCSTNFNSCGMHECDVIMVTESRMIYEYEIKCTLSDFKADFKKVDKHNRLNGTTEMPEWMLRYGTIGKPNYFYYACATGLIPLESIPSYAGLVYININTGSVEVIKKAPKLHKVKAGDELIHQICRNLTARMIYGCSYMNYKNKKHINGINENQ